MRRVRGNPARELGRLRVIAVAAPASPCFAQRPRVNECAYNPSYPRTLSRGWIIHRSPARSLRRRLPARGHRARRRRGLVDTRRRGDRRLAAAVASLMAEHGQVSPASGVAWRDAMAERGLQRATIRQRLAAVGAFTAWSARSGCSPPARPRQSRASASRGSPGSASQQPSSKSSWPCSIAPLARRGPTIRYALRSRGTAPARRLRVASGRAVRRARRDLVPARASAAARATLTGRDVAGWSLRVRGTEGRRSVPVPGSARVAVPAPLQLALARTLVPGAHPPPARQCRRARSDHRDPQRPVADRPACRVRE